MARAVTAKRKLTFTVIGWLILIRGIVWTTFPAIVRKMAPKVINNDVVYYISAIVTLILGIILCILGFSN